MRWGQEPMAWREIDTGEQVWKVSLVAERTGSTPFWRLVLGFRAHGAAPSSFWAPYPLESSSKSMLFAQAEKIPDDKLAALLAAHLR